MRVLLVHNFYQQAGGEDGVVAAERALLIGHGHGAVTYQRSNDELKERGVFGGVATGVETTWSARSCREIRTLLRKEKPDVAHFHNTFPLISPSAYFACAEAGVPVVQTLHNYRLLCPAATFLRDGKVCEECLGWSVPWPGVFHGCYRGSRAATAAAGVMLGVHRTMGTWREKVGVYIALTEFARHKFVEGGLPAERIAVKPNFVSSDPGTKRSAGEYALYLGRLSEEKGLRVLLEAWGRLGERIPLRIAGDGPLSGELVRESEMIGLDGVELVGRVDEGEVGGLMQGARFLVFPSVWFEGFPLTIAEAFACGLPVIASRLGSMAEIVQDRMTGLHFEAGNAGDLAAKVEWAWSHPEEMERMGKAARGEYEAKYTAEKNYGMLMEIYERALAAAHSVRHLVPRGGACP